MSTGNTTVAIPPGIMNPNTPLAFLPPALASQFEASRYLYIASLAVSSHTDSYLAALITSGYQIYSAAQSQRVLDKIPAPLCASQREESGSSTYAYGAAAPSVSEAREVRYV